MTLLGLMVGIVGLVLQFIVSVQMSFAVGRSLPGAIEFFLSFFTVTTNIAVVLVYAAALGGRSGFFARPTARAGIATAITVVSIVYATILSGLWEPTGLFFVADTTLHYVAPVLYVGWWLWVGRSGTSRLADVPWWLVYPFLYLVFAMVRGAVIGLYPYPFLDLTVKSPAQIAQASAMMLGLFLVIALVVLAADRLLPPPRR